MTQIDPSRSSASRRRRMLAEAPARAYRRQLEAWSPIDGSWHPRGGREAAPVCDLLSGIDQQQAEKYMGPPRFTVRFRATIDVAIRSSCSPLNAAHQQLIEVAYDRFA